MAANFYKRWLICLALALIGGCAETKTADKSPPENGVDSQTDIQTLRKKQREEFKTTEELSNPVRLESDGEPIDIALQQRTGGGHGHAGPAIADIDGDGDRDLLVGDFPGHFWLFENETDDTNPSYVAKGKLQAGSEDAKTPVY